MKRSKPKYTLPMLLTLLGMLAIVVGCVNMDTQSSDRTVSRAESSQPVEEAKVTVVVDDPERGFHVLITGLSGVVYDSDKFGKIVCNNLSLMRWMTDPRTFVEATGEAVSDVGTIYKGAWFGSKDNPKQLLLLEGTEVRQRPAGNNKRKLTVIGRASVYIP